MSLKVIQIAQNEIGYLEKASNDQLDSYTANAGYNNWTKYARDLDALPDFYNGRKNGFDWCDMFVDWCMVQAYGREAAQKLLHQPNHSAGAGCKFSLNYYRQAGRFITRNPLPGDQIFFGSPNSSYHTGLVEAVDNQFVYTIEGNTSGASGVVANGGGVCRKKYYQNSSCIGGYGRPDYASVGDDGSFDLGLEDDNMTQDRFNEMMDQYLVDLAKRPASAWSQQDRQWAEQIGLVNGDANGNKMYKKFVTREELVTMMHRLHG